MSRLIPIMFAAAIGAADVPNLTGETRWGTLTQNGRGVSIDGPTWEALGRIRKDGTLYLLWSYKESGRKAPSVYTIKGKDFLEVRGWWGWEDQVKELKDGSLSGRLIQDNLYD